MLTMMVEKALSYRPTNRAEDDDTAEGRSHVAPFRVADGGFGNTHHFVERVESADHYSIVESQRRCCAETAAKQASMKTTTMMMAA